MVTKVLISLLALSLLSAVSAFANPVLNGSFEYGLSGWMTLGGVQTSTSYGGVLPTDRTHMALIYSTGASISDLRSFLGAPNFGGSGDYVAGGAITQTVEMLPGQTISFDWAFASSEQGFENDSAFLFVNSSQVLLSDSRSLWYPSGLNGFTGWRHTTIDAPAGGGTVQISLVAVNLVDDYVTSTLYVDNFQPNQDVPEPATVTVLLPLLVWFAASSCKSRFSHVSR